MDNPNYVVSLSGGKDSTALLLLMLKKNIPVHSVVFFDTGWEFPQMADHLAQLEERTGIEIVRLQPKEPFDYLMFDHVIQKRSGETAVGCGWPVPGPWCRTKKIIALAAYAQTVPNAIECVGFAADEVLRCNSKKFIGRNVRFPLIEWGVDEADALDICYGYGFDWGGGLYNYFDRVSCYLCPQKNLDELRTLRRYFPDLWADMLDRDDRQNHWFKKEKKLRWWDERFAYEESLYAHRKSA